jgi:Ser/Thr protein kinase RdoA (MazF antagonist)
MPHPLVLALFQDRASAADAARRLRSLGLDRKDISVVASTHDLEGKLADEMDATPGVEIEDSAVASRLGEIGGHVVAAIASVLPGIGPIVSAGPLSAELGEAAGHLAGHLARVLRDAGLSDEQAAHWQASVSKGSLLLGAHVRGAAAEQQVRAALDEAGAVDVAMAVWK